MKNDKSVLAAFISGVVLVLAIQFIVAINRPAPNVIIQMPQEQHAPPAQDTALALKAPAVETGIPGVSAPAAGVEKAEEEEEPVEEEPARPTPKPKKKKSELRYLSVRDVTEPPAKGPADAPVTIAEFGDFHCAFCHRVSVVFEQLFEKYPDKIRVIFKHYPLSNAPGTGSFLTHEASVCAQEQGRFWEFHDAVFRMESAPYESDLYQIAQMIGLDEEIFEACLTGGKYRDWIKKDYEEGNRRGVRGTPTSFVNDKMVRGALPFEHFERVVKSILEPGSVPDEVLMDFPTAAPTADAQFQDLTGKPFQGPESAPVTLVEFGDFHCPFCRSLNPTLEMLMQNYPGQIRRVFLHFPLALHPGADRTHEASECAHEQGKFWEYYKLLFETMGGSRSDEALTGLAGTAGLDTGAFQACLESGRTRAVVQKDLETGRAAGVNGTPATFINGKLVSGAVPYPVFESLVKDELAKA